MRNRILSITRNTIPYVPQIMPLAGSVTGCILMQQLDYWFERYSNGFYKFQEPAPGHPQYKTGASWTEELGFGLTEFRNAFDRIGVRYKSKSEWAASEDKFQGKFYCCYTDRRAGLTYYFRNHDSVDAALDTIVHAQNQRQDGPLDDENQQISAVSPIISAKKAPAFPVNKNTKLTVSNQSTNPVNEESTFTANEILQDTVACNNEPTVSARSSFAVTWATPLHGIINSNLQGISKPHSAYMTENTASEITKQQQQSQLSAKAPITDQQSSSGGNLSIFDNVVLPSGLQKEELTALAHILHNCPKNKMQEVLDELEGARQKKTIRTGIIPFTRELVNAVAKGTFTSSLGVSVVAARNKAKELGQILQASVAQADRGAVRPFTDYSDEEIESLPSLVLRERAREAKRMANTTH